MGAIGGILTLRSIGVIYAMGSIGYIMSLRLTRPEDIGAMVKDRRRALGLSQSALGARLGVSRKWVSELEGGKASAHLGLVLGALQTLGVTLLAEHAGIARSAATDTSPSRARRPPISVKGSVDG